MNAVDFRIRPDGTLSHLVYSKKRGRVERNTESDIASTVCETVEEEVEVGWKEDSNLTVMHYTGADDINERPIFEDDIVLFSDDSWDRQRGVIVYDRYLVYGWVISFNEEHKVLGKAMRFGEVEVLGNIHEDPDLVEGAG